MTESPLPTPIDSAPPRPSAGGAIVAWLVIIAVVAFMMYSQFAPEIRGRSSAAGTNDVQFELVGKLLVGMHHLASSASTRPTTSPVSVAAHSQLEQLVRSDRNRMQAAVIIGELDGAAAALDRLAQLDTASLTDDLRQDVGDLQQIYATGVDSVAATTRERLTQSYGYFGRLAATFGTPDTSDSRRQVINEARRAAIVYGAAAIGIIAALCLGVVLLLIGIVLLATGVLRRRYVPEPAGSPVFVEIFAVYLLSFVLISLVVAVVTGGKASLTWSWLMTVSLPIALGWGLMRGTTWTELCRALGWHGGRGWYVELPLGIIGYIAGIPIVAVGLYISLRLIERSGQMPSHPVISVPTDTVLSVLNLIAIASLWAPILEETMFRGALFHHMRRRWNWLISSTVVAFIFAAIHPQGWTMIPVLGSIALVLAGIREWRGSLLAPIAAHACNNFVLVSLLVALK